MELSPQALIEALLFAEGGPMSRKRLQSLLGVSAEMAENVLAMFSNDLEGRGLALVQTDDTVELRTAAAAAPFVDKLYEAERSRDIGKAAMEVLAIVLYKGSATRSEIDWIRGVNSTTALRALNLRGLVTVSEDDADRRRARYTASIDALAHLGVSTADQLPEFVQVSNLLSEREANVVVQQSTED